jgi:hypothetical protein
MEDQWQTSERLLPHARVAWLISVSLGSSLGAPAAHAGVDASRAYIVGGSTVAPGDPIGTSTVLIDIGSDFCSGTMVSADLVVTAAHCVMIGESHDTPAKLDTIRISFPIAAAPHGVVSFVKASGVEVNPLWSQQSSRDSDKADIAAVRMAGKAPPSYRPASTWSGAVPLKAGTDVVLAGFGSVNSLNAPPSVGVLRKASVPIQDPNFGQTEVTLDQTQGAGACFGDSGGPALIESDQKVYFWGVASRGDTDCAQRAIYTRVSAYWDWLGEAATRLGAAQPLAPLREDWSLYRMPPPHPFRGLEQLAN